MQDKFLQQTLNLGQRSLTKIVFNPISSSVANICSENEGYLLYSYCLDSSYLNVNLVADILKLNSPWG